MVKNAKNPKYWSKSNIVKCVLNNGSKIVGFFQKKQ